MGFLILATTGLLKGLSCSIFIDDDLGESMLNVTFAAKELVNLQWHNEQRLNILGSSHFYACIHVLYYNINNYPYVSETAEFFARLTITSTSLFWALLRWISKLQPFGSSISTLTLQPLAALRAILILDPIG